jgi:hypothetical protein
MIYLNSGAKTTTPHAVMPGLYMQPGGREFGYIATWEIFFSAANCLGAVISLMRREPLGADWHETVRVQVWDRLRTELVSYISVIPKMSVTLSTLPKAILKQVILSEFSDQIWSIIFTNLEFEASDRKA